jgi:hypothetical protein
MDDNPTAIDEMMIGLVCGFVVELVQGLLALYGRKGIYGCDSPVHFAVMLSYLLDCEFFGHSEWGGGYRRSAKGKEG